MMFLLRCYHSDDIPLCSNSKVLVPWGKKLDRWKLISLLMMLVLVVIVFYLLKDLYLTFLLIWEIKVAYKVVFYSENNAPF